MKKYQFRTFIGFVGLLLLGILLVGDLLLGISWLAIPPWLKIVIFIIAVAGVFFFILSGRDFFSAYLNRSILVLVLLYGVAFVSMAVMTHSGQTAIYSYIITEDTIARLQQNNIPNEVLVKLRRLLGKEYIDENALAQTLRTSIGEEDSKKFEQLIIKNAQYRATLNLVTPGTIMVLFLAVVTVVGFTITITRLQESHMRISGYETFLIRLGRFLDITLHAHRPPDVWINKLEWQVRKLLHLVNDDYEGLKVLCSVPTLGNMSHHDLFYGKVYKRWKSVAWTEQLKVELICIDPIFPNGVTWDNVRPDESNGMSLYSKEDFSGSDEKNICRKRLLAETSIGKFYNNFSERGFTEDRILCGMVEAFDIIRAFESSRQNNKRILYKWNSRDSSPPVHLFWTRSRALVAIPLDRGIRAEDYGSAVTMVGYETTDASVIERLLEVYNEWKAEILRRQSQIESETNSEQNELLLS